MDYKQHKGNLRGKIKDKVERKLYNKRLKNYDELQQFDCLIQDSCLRFKKEGCNENCKLYL